MFKTRLRNESKTGGNNYFFQIVRHHRPIMIYGERFELEHICWDPKDGDLCLGRIKPGETLVEVRKRF